jgi:hypothetical protein
LGRRIVAPSLKENFDIWLKKNEWTSFVQKYSLDIGKELADVEDDLAPEQRKEDSITELSQIAFVQDCTMNEVSLLRHQKFV